MIFGLNFNGQPIPRGINRKFPRTVRVQCDLCLGRRVFLGEGGVQDACRMCRQYPKSQIGRGYLTYELKGVGQSPEERDAMLVQANNGHRRLHVVERQTPVGTWYGIYVY